jgi:hypothetical protein
MNNSLAKDIEAWEGEGGAAPAPLGVRAISMSGKINQVEWAVRIKRQVDDEFDRVALSFRSVAAKQNGAARADTEAILAILEEKRAEVMGRGEAGYFIHDWQEIGDQVRQMIFWIRVTRRSRAIGRDASAFDQLHSQGRSARGRVAEERLHGVFHA